MWQRNLTPRTLVVYYAYLRLWSLINGQLNNLSTPPLSPAIPFRFMACYPLKHQLLHAPTEGTYILNDIHHCYHSPGRNVHPTIKNPVPSLRKTSMVIAQVLVPSVFI
mmetsp:Transcript_28336/g.50997  ORF Transcript_28336/g.50997 Transcript_28336/m.50997 type:complete len:108 (-) Transcript_28336:152-475(-)